MIIDANLTALVRALSEALPAFAHLDASRILFVAGAARLSARASIRPLVGDDDAFVKPIVEIGGVRMLYEICLRPRFFLDATPDERIGIVIHELWHIGDELDGRLDPARRHDAAGDHVEAEVETLLSTFLAHDLSSVGLFFRDEGEMRMRAWRVRPPSRIPITSEIRRRYDERDLFLAVVGGKGLRDG